MTLMCIDRSQSPTHKGSFLQGRKSPVNNNNNNNINQQNAHNNRRNSCSPPLSKNQHQQDAIKSQNLESRKLERSASEPDRRAVQTNSSRYKTELCRPFEENGTCKYGDKCQFAHGVKELRSMARHPKYKTELCRTFHSTGLCPYGPRCHFIHNSEQAKKSLLTNLATNGTTTTTRAVSVTTQPVTVMTQQPISRQKALTSLGSAGDISPVSSHGGTPTGMKSFDDLYRQPPLSPVSIAQTLVNNLNHPNFEFASVDCFSDTFNLIADARLGNGDSNFLDNYGYIGGFVSEYSPMTPASEEGFYLRLPIFDRIQSKQ